MMTFAGLLAHAFVSASIGQIMGAMLRASGRHQTPENLVSGENQMSGFDIVGEDFDDDMLMEGDDDVGAIGEDIIFSGDDDDVLEALAISGAGDTEIVGADDLNDELAEIGRRRVRRRVRRRPRVRSRRRGRAAMRRIAGQGRLVVRRGLDRGRRYPLGAVPTTIVASGTAEIPTNPQNLFRVERLVVPSDIAFDIGILDIKVGNQSQLAQSAELPAAMFTEVAIDTDVTFDTAEVGNQLSIRVRNKDTANSIVFTAGFLGVVAK